jgi:hypothetical protein
MFLLAGAELLTDSSQIIFDGQGRTEGPVVADQVGALLDPGSSAFRCADTDFLTADLRHSSRKQGEEKETSPPEQSKHSFQILYYLC